MEEKELQTGSVDIELTTPIKIDGVEVTTLRMREPSVNDQLVHEARKGPEPQKEVASFADLCSVTEADIRALKLRDYRKLQRAFAGFLE